MSETATAQDFEEMSWHDNLIYGVSWNIGDAEQGDWRRDVSFDIEYIAEWVKGADGGVKFRVAPATLAFHEVTDLRVNVDFGDSNSTNAIGHWTIHAITRELVDDPKRFPERDYYRWRIELNWPDNSEISFGARNFSQTLRAEPVLLDEQYLPAGTPR